MKLPTKVTVELPKDVYRRLEVMGEEAGVDVAGLLGMFIHVCLEIYEGKKVV